MVYEAELFVDKSTCDTLLDPKFRGSLRSAMLLEALADPGGVEASKGRLYCLKSLPERWDTL